MFSKKYTSPESSHFVTKMEEVFVCSTVFIEYVFINKHIKLMNVFL